MHTKTADFLTQYANETKKSTEWLIERLQQINQTTYYAPSTDELTYAAKLAWRNSNKCIGRLFWQSLTVFDERHLTTSESIFSALLRHIQYATNEGKIRPTMTVFKQNYVRIWNEQLLRYAAYETAGGIIGDPISLAFTKKCEALGWKSKRTAFDLLPLVIQIKDQPPQLFHIPKEIVKEVSIRHTCYPAIDALQLKWYAVPILSNMSFNCGESSYDAAPFNGWYMGTEIGARNFADEDRYNLLPKIAHALHLDTTRNRLLWKDRALVELNIAVLDSFQREGVTIVDHHTAAQQYTLFEKQERKANREVTGNWAWLVPPLSPATTNLYHRPLNNEIKQPNFTVKKEALRNL